jgi:hypothetical protein
MITPDELAKQIEGIRSGTLPKSPTNPPEKPIYLPEHLLTSEKQFLKSVKGEILKYEYAVTLGAISHLCKNLPPNTENDSLKVELSQCIKKCNRYLDGKGGSKLYLNALLKGKFDLEELVKKLIHEMPGADGNQQVLKEISAFLHRFFRPAESAQSETPQIADASPDELGNKSAFMRWTFNSRPPESSEPSHIIEANSSENHAPVVVTQIDNPSPEMPPTVDKSSLPNEIPENSPVNAPAMDVLLVDSPIPAVSPTAALGNSHISVEIQTEVRVSTEVTLQTSDLPEVKSNPSLEISNVVTDGGAASKTENVIRKLAVLSELTSTHVSVQVLAGSALDAQKLKKIRANSRPFKAITFLAKKMDTNQVGLFRVSPIGNNVKALSNWGRYGTIPPVNATFNSNDCASTIKALLEKHPIFLEPVTSVKQLESLTASSSGKEPKKSRREAYLAVSSVLKEIYKNNKLAVNMDIDEFCTVVGAKLFNRPILITHEEDIQNPEKNALVALIKYVFEPTYDNKLALITLEENGGLKYNSVQPQKKIFPNWLRAIFSTSK